MAEYKLPGTYCMAARDKIMELILDWSKYKDSINIETEEDMSGTGFDNYVITVVAPTIGQDELVEDVTRLVLSEFNNLVYDKSILLGRCFEDFKKSVDYEQFKTYIINNQGLKAVKLVKDRTHCGLKEAHEFWKVQKEGYDKFGYFSA